MVKLYYSKNDEPVATIEQQSEIVKWTRDNYTYFRITKPLSYRNDLNVFGDDVPSCIWDIKRKIMDMEQLHEYAPETDLSDSIGYTVCGGYLHKHTDRNPPNSDLIHTRFNVYVQIPDKGGLPIYADQLCSLKERTYICCRSGMDIHYTDAVEGNRERIVLSFGFFIPRTHLLGIVYDY